MKSAISDSEKITSSSKLSKLGGIFVLFIGILLGLSLIRNISTIISAEDKIKQTSDRLVQAQKENQRYKAELKGLDSDFFREKQARDQLGLSKEGEVVVILPEEELLRRLSPITNEGEIENLPEPTWKRWKSLFF